MPKNEVECREDSKYGEWEIKDALRTLTRAEEIKNDEKMMKYVSAEMKRQEEAFNESKKGITGLVEMTDKEYKDYLKKVKAI